MFVVELLTLLVFCLEYVITSLCLLRRDETRDESCGVGIRDLQVIQVGGICWSPAS